MNPPARLGLLGCGWIARNRVRQIAGLKLAEVAAVIDPDPGAVAAVEAMAPGARRVSGPEELAALELDGVMISTPSALHAAQAMTLLELRVPVFVQKPLGRSADEVGRVLERARAADLPIATDFCYRHLESARAMRAAARRIGEPFRVEACFHNAYRPGSCWSHDYAMAGGGALMDLGIHLVDLVMWLTGVEDLSLARAHLLCRGQPWAERRVEDFAALDLQLENGAPVSLVVSWDACAGVDAEIRLRLYGERGWLELRNRNGSFFDFESRLCRGTHAEVIGRDDGDSWQAGPLRAWLHSIRRGAGYSEPPAVSATAAIIDRAYGRDSHGAPLPSAATESVHAFGRKGVLL